MTLRREDPYVYDIDDRAYDDDGTAATVNGFVKKLHLMVTREDPSIISFTPDGEAIHVRDPQRLESEVLPQYFRHSRFQSFIRQLNFYAFVKSSNQREIWIYKHPCFKRGRPELLEALKRKPSPSARALHTTRVDGANARTGSRVSCRRSSAPIPFEEDEGTQTPQGVKGANRCINRWRSGSEDGDVEVEERSTKKRQRDVSPATGLATPQRSSSGGDEDDDEEVCGYGTRSSARRAMRAVRGQLGIDEGMELLYRCVSSEDHESSQYATPGGSDDEVNECYASSKRRPSAKQRQELSPWMPVYMPTEADRRTWRQVTEAWSAATVPHGGGNEDEQPYQTALKDGRAESETSDSLRAVFHGRLIEFFMTVPPFTSIEGLAKCMRVALAKDTALRDALREHKLALDPSLAQSFCFSTHKSKSVADGVTGAGDTLADAVSTYVMERGGDPALVRDFVAFGLACVSEEAGCVEGAMRDVLRLCATAWMAHVWRLY